MSGVLPVRKIYVDSRYKTKNRVSDAHFKFELLETVSLPEKCVCYIDDVIIPNSWANIDEKNNKLLVRVEQIRIPGIDNEIITLA